MISSIEMNLLAYSCLAAILLLISSYAEVTKQQDSCCSSALAMSLSSNIALDN